MSNRSGGSAVFRVVEELRARMAGGSYQLDSLLPAQRDLAEELSVSRDTVQRALKQLKAEGWVKSRQGSGTRVVKVQNVQSSSAKGRVTLRDFFDEAFARPDVHLDVATLTSENLNTQVRGQIERIRERHNEEPGNSENPPRRVTIRLLLPSERVEIPYVRAQDDTDSAVTVRLRERLLDLSRKHSDLIQEELRQMQEDGLVESAGIEIRHVDMAPSCKLYLINGTQALYAPYTAAERVIVLGDEEKVAALDVKPGVRLTHYAKDDNPQAHGSVFVDDWQEWFDSMWAHVAS